MVFLALHQVSFLLGPMEVSQDHTSTKAQLITARRPVTITT